MPTASSKAPEGRFWDWFQANEERLFAFEKEQDAIFGELMRELRRVNRSLTFEFSSEEQGRRQFAISADGKRDAFPAVIKLAEAAPNLPRWQIVKFRPRKSEPCTIGLGGNMISSDDVQFTLEPEGHKVGVTLYLGDTKNFDERVFGQIAFLFLDQTLGEYDVETWVGTVDIKPLDTLSKQEKRPLRDLPVMFDRFVKSLTN